MYRNKYHPRNQARAESVQISTSVYSRLIYSSLLLLVLCTVAVSSAQAAAFSNTQTTVHVTSDAYAQTVGYRVAWVERMSKRAEQAFKQDEHQLARRVWTALAEQGHAIAAYKLGMVYDMGLGVERDASTAALWYRRSAEDGNPHAQHNLAVAYANGDGVELNMAMAMRWWQAAAQNGNSDSQYNLGIVYAMGVHGIKKNIDMAKKWWRKAAIEGDAMAQYNLGTIYANGEGQVKSYCEAMRWWEKSAQKGIQQANWALQIIKTRRDFRACW